MKISKEEELKCRTPPKRTKKETQELLELIRKDTAKVRAMIKRNGGQNRMSILYCFFCDEYIDTDYDSEHYLSDGECELEAVERLKDEGLTEEEIINKLEEIE